MKKSFEVSSLEVSLQSHDERSVRVPGPHGQPRHFRQKRPPEAEKHRVRQVLSYALLLRFRKRRPFTGNQLRRHVGKQNVRAGRVGGQNFGGDFDIRRNTHDATLENLREGKKLSK